MKASKFSDAHKAFILKQVADGVPVADIFRLAGISQAAYFNWKKKYEGLAPLEMRRLTSASDSLRQKADSLDTAHNRRSDTHMAMSASGAPGAWTAAHTSTF